VSAVDYNTGKVVWQAKTPQPMIGGILATSGGLLFTGEANGLFNSYHAANGKVLWQFQTGAGVNAPRLPTWSAANSTSLLERAATPRSSQARQRHHRLYDLLSFRASLAAPLEQRSGHFCLT
jgi:outer membrane protein assembly factor BamB